MLFRQEGLLPSDVAGQYLSDGLELLILNQLVLLPTHKGLLLSKQLIDQLDAAIPHGVMVAL